jgi:transposase-like protein
MLKVAEFSSAQEMLAHYAALNKRTWGHQPVRVPSAPALRLVNGGVLSTVVEGEASEPRVPPKTSADFTPIQWGDLARCIAAYRAARATSTYVPATELTWVTVNELLIVTAFATGVLRNDLVAVARTGNYARARHIAMWLAYRYTVRPLIDIGLRIGGRDHTTCLYGVRAIGAIVEKIGQPPEETPQSWAKHIWDEGEKWRTTRKEGKTVAISERVHNVTPPEKKLAVLADIQRDTEASQAVIARRHGVSAALVSRLAAEKFGSGAFGRRVGRKSSKVSEPMTLERAREMREDHRNGYPNHFLQKKYGFARSHIRRIILNHHWCEPGCKGVAP